MPGLRYVEPSPFIFEFKFPPLNELICYACKSRIPSDDWFKPNKCPNCGAINDFEHNGGWIWRG